MFWFKNFRIRRVLCDKCDLPSRIHVVKPSGERTHYCVHHAYIGRYWAEVTSSKIYTDTGAITE